MSEELNTEMQEQTMTSGENDSTEVAADNKALGGELPKTQETETQEGQETETGAPMDYTLPELPEGMTVDNDLLGELAPTLRELGLTQEQFAKLASTYATAMGTKNAAFTAQQQEAEAAQKQAAEALDKEWFETRIKDPEIGGKDWEEKLNQANRTYSNTNLVSDGLHKALTEAGLHKHPEVIRLFYRLDKAFADDKGFFGKGAGAMTKEEFDKLPYEEQHKYKQQNPKWKETLGVRP